MIENPIFNTPLPQKPRVLVAPLDWGIGHATRCVPVIRKLLELDCEVLIGALGAGAVLLSAEFPDLTVINPPPYNVKYASFGWQTRVKMILQVPKILTAIKKENRWLQEMKMLHNIQGVISDSRPGLCHPSIPSVLITHQLSLHTGFGTWVDKLATALNRRQVRAFTEIWVPDTEQQPGLAGKLSHPEKPGAGLRYIGPLTRFDLHEADDTGELVILLSGPEPQRTLFEQIILSQTGQVSEPITLLRGLPGGYSGVKKKGNLTIYDHLSAVQLQEIVRKAKVVISRSGYSTVMDVVPMGKRCVFVPTPGQGEQEYLARHLAEQQLAINMSQKHFQLDRAVQEAMQLNVAVKPVSSNQLQNALLGLIARLQ